jgi:uncharacterized membrane protein YfcA
LTFQHGVLVGGAAFLASGINAGAGGGSFISFPAILAAGIAPISANATNNTAMWVGGLSSTGALRSELTVERKTLLKMLGVSIVGSILGAVVLLRTSNSAFTQLIPLLLLFSTLLFIFGPGLTRAVRSRRTGISLDSPAGLAAQFVIAVYGGFFGAAAGILMLALLGLLGMTDMRRANALKVLLATTINGIAVIPFVIARAIAWDAALVACTCALAGGYIGAAVVKRLPSLVIRRFVIVGACTMTAYFFWKTYIARAA